MVVGKFNKYLFQIQTTVCTMNSSRNIIMENYLNKRVGWACRLRHHLDITQRDIQVTRFTLHYLTQVRLAVERSCSETRDRPTTHSVHTLSKILQFPPFDSIVIIFIYQMICKDLIFVSAR